MLKRDSWRIVETIIKRYPYRKKEYEEYIADIMSASAGSSALRNPDEEENRPQSVTEAKALKMTSVYAERIKKEIRAVEFVYNNLKPEEQKIIRLRYWSGKKTVPYLQLTECSYSERQMKRIVYKVITQVGRYIGEIR